MMNRFAIATAALLVFAAAPAFAQCCPAAKAQAVAQKQEKKTCTQTCDTKAKAVSAKDECAKSCASSCEKATAVAVKDGECSKKCGSSCGASATAVAAKDECAKSCGSKCSDAKMMMVKYRGVEMPAMVVAVKGKPMGCEKAAMAACNGDAKSMSWMVAGKQYNCKTEALKAHSAKLAHFVKDMMVVKYVVGDECVGCPTAAKQLAAQNSGKMHYRVASFDFKSRSDADKALKAGQVAFKNWKKSDCSSTCSDAKAVSAKSTCDPAKCEKAGCDKMATKAGKCCGTCNGSCMTDAKAVSAKSTCDASKCEKAGCDKNAEAVAAKAGCCTPAGKAVAAKDCAKSCDPAKCDKAGCDKGAAAVRMVKVECCPQTLEAHDELVARIQAALDAIASVAEKSNAPASASAG